MLQESETYKSLRERYPEVININQYAEILQLDRKTITGSTRLRKIMFLCGNKYRVSLWNVAKLIDGK